MLEPFLKWAGGKRWLVQRYSDFMPTRFRRYIEPFLGGGAVFFHLRPKRATLSDSNGELINAYRVIKDDPQGVQVRLQEYQQSHGPDFYYKMRQTTPKEPLTQAARFLYLNRTCFNGLYRVNKQGIFNVPIGTKTAVEFPDNYLGEIASALQHATLRVSDFEPVIHSAVKDDFLYIDPPYTVMHNTNNFIKYNANLFSWDDQVRLSHALRKAAKRGVLIMLSNANHECIKTLYHGFGTHHEIQRTSILAGCSEHRRRTTELLITNYAPA